MPTALPTLSVAQFLDVTNDLLANAEAIVQGEVTSIKTSGKAVYFSLTDPKENAVLKCMVWLNVLNSFGLTLTEGMEVKVWGIPQVYKPYGTLSLMAKNISPVGEGALRLAFEQLKKRLHAAGYFSPERKKTLPQYPTTIGVITSERGAAINDFRTHLAKVGLRVELFDALVQGPQAVASLVSGIEWFNQQPQAVDLIVITRGGGSLEDLQSFNSEVLAKALFASKIPTVSAVGHEDDVSICDLVADVRASTPTAAAKLICQHWQSATLELPKQAQRLLGQTELLLHKRRAAVARYQEMLPHRFQQVLNQEWQLLHSVQQELHHHVTSLLDTFHATISEFGHHFKTWELQRQKLLQRLAQQQQRLVEQFAFVLTTNKQKVAHQLEKLSLSNPELKLKQGYAIVRTAAGGVLKNSTQVHRGENLAIQLHHGTIQSTVTDTTP